MYPNILRFSRQQYQLWVVAGRQALPAGVFNVDAVGHNALTVRWGLYIPIGSRSP